MSSASLTGFKWSKGIPQPSGGCLCGGFSDDDQYIALGAYNTSVLIYNVVNGGYVKPTATLNTQMTSGKEMKSPVTAVKFRPNSKSFNAMNVLLVTSSDGGVCHWHVGSSKLLHGFHEEGNQVLAADYAPTGLQFATAGSDFKIRVYDEERRTVIQTLKDSLEGSETLAHSGRIQSLRYKPDDPRIILSGGWDYLVHIWQAMPVRSIYGPYLTGDGLDVKGDLIVTGSSREKDSLQLWQFSSGKHLMTIPWPDAVVDKGLDEDGVPLPGDDTSLMTAKFSHNGNYIAAGGRNDLRVFDITKFDSGHPESVLVQPKVNCKTIRKEQDSGYHCSFHASFSSDDRQLLVATAGEEAFLFAK